jgi:hypothetical protein
MVMRPGTIITATEATRSFSDLLNQVCYQGKTFDIKRGREIIAKITPAFPTSKGITVTSLNDFFDNLPSLDHEDASHFQKTLAEVRAKSKKEKNPWD